MNIYSKDDIVKLMIKKRQEGTIHTFMEFRILKRIFSSKEKGVEKELIVKNFKKFLESKPTRDKSGKLIPAMSIADLFEITSKTVYTEIEIIRFSEKLISMFSEKNFKITNDEYKKILSDLIQKIKSVLESQ